MTYKKRESTPPWKRRNEKRLSAGLFERHRVVFISNRVDSTLIDRFFDDILKKHA